jgi:hypothetical protein
VLDSPDGDLRALRPAEAPQTIEGNVAAGASITRDKFRR